MKKQKRRKSPPPVPVPWKMFKALCWIAAPFGIFAYGMLLFRETEQTLLLHSSCRYAGYGFTVGCLLWPLASRFLTFYQVFIHELTHLVMGLLFFKKPKRLMASDEGGLVDMYGGNFVITLAPYFFPLVSFVLVLVAPLLNTAFLDYYYILLGFFTGAHIVSVALQFRPHQPDIRETGLVFSLLFCTAGNIIILTGILGFLVNEYAGIWLYLRQGFSEAVTAGQILLESYGKPAYGYFQNLLSL